MDCDTCEKMKLLIADDHAMYRDLIKAMLMESYPHAEIMEAESYEQVKTACETSKPCLLVLDVYMPGMDGLVGVRKIIKSFPDIMTLICTGIDNPILARTMLAFGARGYVSKNMPAHRLLDSIKTVMRGELFAPEEILHDAKASRLTKRQYEVLGLMCMGLSNKEIANQLDISLHTIKFHVKTILRILNAQNRLQIISMSNQPYAAVSHAKGSA